MSGTLGALCAATWTGRLYGAISVIDKDEQDILATCSMRSHSSIVRPNRTLRAHSPTSAEKPRPRSPCALVHEHEHADVCDDR